MKKRTYLLLLLCFLLCLVLSKEKIKGLPDFALESFSSALEDPFWAEVFDLEKEEAMAVFGNCMEDTFV